MTLWEAVTWNVARSGGFTAYVLLMLSVAVGLALSTRLQSAGKWPRIINAELHNFLALLATVFTVVHVLAIWIDPYMNFGWYDVLIPFMSSYSPLWMATGITALYLGIAIGISTWIRPFIGYAWWRRLHILTLGVYVLVTAHGFMIGSDTYTWWGLTIYGTGALLVGGLLCRRLLLLAGSRKQARPVVPALQEEYQRQ